MKDLNENQDKVLAEESKQDEVDFKNADATLTNQPLMQADAPVMSNQAGNAADENLMQSAQQDGETAPEFGDAADPANEVLGQHHRDE